jgi:LytTr DNA-binding domain
LSASLDAGGNFWNHRAGNLLEATLLFTDSRQLPAQQLQILAAIAGAATALALLTTAQAGAALAYEGESVPWNGLLRARLVDWYAYAIFVPALWRLARRFPIAPRGWQKSLPLYLLLGLPVAIAKEAIYTAIGNVFRPGVFSLPNILAEDLSSEVVTAWALIGLVHAVAFYRARAPHADEAAQPCENEPANHLAVRDRGAHRLVRIADIEWIDAQGNYARLVTPHGRYLVRETMAALERRLAPGFLRVHRRLLVNLAKVERIEPRSHAEYWLHLASGERLASARSYGERIRRLL